MKIKGRMLIKNKKSNKFISFYGVGVLENNNIAIDNNDLEMWECDIAIIPKKKYRKGYQGQDISEVMNLGLSPDTWEWEECESQEEENKTNVTSAARETLALLFNQYENNRPV